MHKTRFGIKSSLLVFALCGCVTRDYRGGVPIRPLQMELVKSAQTKAEVAEILGSPAATTVVGTEKWFYYNAEGSQFAFFDPQYSKYNILTITFDESGKISDIRLHELKDSNFAYNEKVETELPSEIKLNFFQELFGNIGRFNNSGMGGN